ncbi:MAG TPA: beta-L-arabinofuranosidase domain-containing protein, partial [Fimbriimonas sp.]|nr:beta-L-arabinofuranosidase domain-containing protein [Fimbriimonas sp.]
AQVYNELPDVLHPLRPNEANMEGYLGNRINLSAKNRLKQVDLEPLLAGYRTKPGSHPWIGEHIGKWIHAATLAWQSTKDDQLKEKLDKAVTDLIATQEPDGYLGTYTPNQRFGLYPGADWDVWSHKYNLIGLLAYYQATKNPEALKACERIGDLMLATFGKDKKSILQAGTHVGMAATSILEPMVLLHRATGKYEYLEFTRYLARSWEDQGGPKIISTLIKNRPIDEVGNGKAYEMLSNLVGLCELARTTGDKVCLDAAKKGWDQVVKNQLYITGTASYYEHFHKGRDLPNRMGANVGETCVTVTWMQLCQQLLRLTGEAKYAEELERAAYNHLAGAQRPDGAAWCYYTSLEGTKPYTQETCCCLSSGPRGMAILPQTAVMPGAINKRPVLFINSFESGDYRLAISHFRASVKLVSQFPNKGSFTVGLHTSDIRPSFRGTFGVAIRIPTWATWFKCSLPGTKQNGWYVIQPAALKIPGTGDAPKFSVSFGMEPRLKLGTDTNKGLAAWTYGPYVLASELNVRRPVLTKAPPKRRSGLNFDASAKSEGKPATMRMVPFAEVGATGQRYRVWFPAPGSVLPANQSVFADAEESRSAAGNVDGSIVDGDTGTFVVTYNGTLQPSAFFAVTANQPVAIRRIVFGHGKAFHDGGWFDTSGGKPRVEVQLTKGGAWTPAGVLSSYPLTSGASAGSLRDGQTFSLSLPQAMRVYGVRVTGKPAGGDSTSQSFTSCSELQAKRV